MKSAKLTDYSILRVFLAKSFCIFYHFCRASCHVTFKAHTGVYCKIVGWGLFSARSGYNVVLQGFVSKLLRCIRDIGQPHQWRLGSSRSLNTAREDKQLIQMVIDNRFIPTARLCVEMIRRFLRRLSVRSMVNRLLAAGYQSGSLARCPRLTLDHRRCRHVWGGTHRRWDLRHWMHCVFSVKYRFTLLWWSCSCALQARERPIDAWIQPLDGDHGHGLGYYPPPHKY